MIDAQVRRQFSSSLASDENKINTVYVARHLIVTTITYFIKTSMRLKIKYFLPVKHESRNLDDYNSELITCV